MQIRWTYVSKHGVYVTKTLTARALLQAGNQ